MVFLHANARHSKPKVASRCGHAANIAFDLFNFFFYVIARKVRKCPLSPFVTSNVVLSCLVRMADVLARLVQKADSRSALQLTGALWNCLSNTTPPPIHPYPKPPPPPPPLFGPLRRPWSLGSLRRKLDSSRSGGFSLQVVQVMQVNEVLQ